MECQVTTTGYQKPSSGAKKATNGVQGGTAAPHDKSHKSGLHVNFVGKVEVKKRREKFLTAKYGSHQMSLIRKRLAVEMWLYEELQKLSALANLSEDFEVDIDELLDIDNDDERRHHVKDSLSKLHQQCPKDLERFVEELLEKSKTL